MSFLYPLFLAAGIVLAIPVLIHLFNLRRYKTVFFPHTRFLKNIQLHSQRRREVRYKWLLLTRLLLLLFLVLAFAQPFFGSSGTESEGERLQVIYLDNSYSMSAQNGARRLLDIARDAVVQQVGQGSASDRFMLLTNDRPLTDRPVPAAELLTSLHKIDISPAARTCDQVLMMVQNYIRNEPVTGADLYYYSDFQRSGFTPVEDTALLGNIRLHGVPIQARSVQHFFIDTAWLMTPALQSGQRNQLIVRTKAAGKVDEMPVLQLRVNDQVKTAVSLDFSDAAERLDTLAFQVNEAGWQQLMLTVNDGMIRFDDTFRITARSTPGLSVMVWSEGVPNPYIQAAFRASEGFRLTQLAMNQAPKQLQDYNLIIVSGITRLDTASGALIRSALQSGQSVCIFPGRTSDPGGFNEGLRAIGDIQFTGIDTAAQVVSTLQQGHDLVRDIFERIPEQVQLPAANWHYMVKAGLGANQQPVLSFRNGDPFLAAYTPSRGHLYICATSADLSAGNFPVSYFFVPFLYRMAMQSGGSSVYAISSGRQQAVYLPLDQADERNMVHLYGEGLDAVPPQRISGDGLQVFIDQVVQQPGFYTLAAATGDSTLVALNADRSESDLQVWDMATLKKQWSSGAVSWSEPGKTGASGDRLHAGGFPLWKVCIILALFMLSAETILLAGSLRKQTVATQ